MCEDLKRTVDQTIPIREVDNVEIVSLVDNTVDFLSTLDRKEVKSVRVWVREKKGEKWMKEHFIPPIAEHGFSNLIRVFYEGKVHNVLFDTGASPVVILANVGGMGLDLSEIEVIVLSHGHYDHFGGLPAVLRRINRALPIIVHEDMFKTRGTASPDGTIRESPAFPTEEQVKPARYVKTKSPYLLFDDTVLVTGEVSRVTEFEKGVPQQRALIDGKWQPDPWVWDDRAIVVNVKRKGLVIISGCAHAGIINTTLYAQQITGITDVYAVTGGFHLAGREYEPTIAKTVEKLKMMDPKIVAPSHCTGWRGICAIAKAMPQAFVWNSVGNLYRF
jgi:7,8-dihydropterin-6-yl-methyl-4-(beta-D-ribofuranosyl)aminobenzene 5'-phosphate synthase